MSFEKDITEIQKMIKEYKPGVETMPAPAPGPVITPELPTQKPDRPMKPHTPIRPTPGITPKPKAVMTQDAELFLRKRNLLGGQTAESVVEAKPKTPKQKEYDVSVVPPEKLKWIQTGDETLNKILPGLPEEQREYLIKINSESYTELVDRIEDITGLTVTKANFPKLVGMTMAAIQEVQSVESKNKVRLEELAMELVFSVPEFKIVEQAYLNDEITIDAKIAPAELQKLTNPEQDEQQEIEGLTNDEELNFKMAEFLESASDEDIKRRFANLMITGGAVGKLNLFHMMADRIKKINPKLPELYGVLAAVVQLGYWVTPFGVEKVAASQAETSAGSEEVKPEGGRYIIRARGITFPYLVHELVKGIYEYLSLDPNQQIAMQKDKLEDETVDFMAGPGIHKAVMAYIPQDKQELIPLVQKKLVAMGPAEIRDVLGNTARGKEIMNGLISQADKEWGEYKASKAKYEEAV